MALSVTPRPLSPAWPPRGRSGAQDGDPQRRREGEPTAAGNLPKAQGTAWANGPACPDLVSVTLQEAGLALSGVFGEMSPHLHLVKRFELLRPTQTP